MKRTAMRYCDGKLKKEDVSVSEEDLFHLFVNKACIVSMFASPRNLRELVVGFLASEGIANHDSITAINILSCEIWVETSEDKQENLKQPTELRTSGCSGILQVNPEPIISRQIFDMEVIQNSLGHLDRSMDEWKLTGGTHGACIITHDGEFLSGFEDIGRHNALDKAIGWMLINNQILGDKFILFSGRLSTGIVTKIARVGIPLIVSNTAPFSRAINIAEELNVTLIGFARHPRFTVYTNPWRINMR